MKTVFRLTLWFIGILLMPGLQAATTQGPLVLGAERMDVITRLLKDKQVGLVINQTSILEKQQKHLLDALVEKGIQVKKVFAPEHGFRGTADAGEEVKDSRDLKTGVPIVSIYGKHKKPTAEQLNGLDVIVFDIQDVGARFYTYISTMHYVMEACAENGVEFIVLDRPNPNDFVDGPIRQKGFESFVGVDPIPLLHGLTVGELAWMINSEGWLKSSPDSCKLHIVKMENWKHGDPYWLPVKPSPNLPNDQSIRLYPSLCFFEATQRQCRTRYLLSVPGDRIPGPEIRRFRIHSCFIAGLRYESFAKRQGMLRHRPPGISFRGRIDPALFPGLL